MTTKAERPDANQNDLLERIVKLTEAVEYAAGLADWQEAARLMTERSPLLMSLSAKQSPSALADIRRIQTIDAAVRDNATMSRAGLEAEYHAAMNSTKAARQYHRVALL